MAQTKRRRTKHRGNAAGMIEARGRTGRKPSEAEKKGTSTKSSARPNRFDQPPTWRSAINRALIAIVFFALLVILIFKQPVGNAIALSGVMLVLYVPLGYYTDLFMYRRRQRSKQAAAAKAKESK